jgi:hypothetical protein
MSAGISFTDGTGAATLTNGLAAPQDRFSNWVPDVVPVGEHKDTLADGITHEFTFRTDYTASLDLTKIPASSQATMLRLKAHLLAGNTVTVTTADTSSHVYTARLAPGTVPEIVFSDPARLRYTFRVTFKNTSAAAMLCTY